MLRFILNKNGEQQRKDSKYENFIGYETHFLDAT